MFVLFIKHMLSITHHTTFNKQQKVSLVNEKVNIYSIQLITFVIHCENIFPVEIPTGSMPHKLRTYFTELYSVNFGNIKFKLSKNISSFI